MVSATFVKQRGWARILEIKDHFYSWATFKIKVSFFNITFFILFRVTFLHVHFDQSRLSFAEIAITLLKNQGFSISPRYFYPFRKYFHQNQPQIKIYITTPFPFTKAQDPGNEKTLHTHSLLSL